EEEEEEEVAYDVGEGGDGDAESDRVRTRRYAVWRKFATSYLNKLRVFFSAPSRLRVLREVHNVVEDEEVKLKGIIEIRWTSSEENAIYSFMRIKHVWIALQQISLSVERSNQERMKAASFLRVVKSLKFCRYMVFQLQILGQISVLSKEAQSEATLLWKADRDLDEMLQHLNDMAERPTYYVKTRPFLQEVLCKPVTDRGHFRRNALDSRDCERWFWNGWQYEGYLVQEIQYKIRHDTLESMFNREAGGFEIDEEQALLDNIAGELNAERDNLIHWLRNPQNFPAFNEEVTRRSISELKISEDFRRASFTNMDHAKRTLLVTNVGGALRSRLEYERNSVLYAISGFSPKSLRNYNADEKSTRDVVSSFFGYPSLEEDVQQLSRQLSRLPAEQRREFDKAEKKCNISFPSSAVSYGLVQLESLIAEVS
ncbi:unnamed protein product, partial [Cylicostephanus goldi]